MFSCCFELYIVQLYGKIVNNPNIKVRGFVSASNTTKKRFFINAADLKTVKSTWVSGKVVPRAVTTTGYAAIMMYYLTQGYAVVSDTPYQIKDADDAYYPSSINVLLTGGTKDKPDWWPNDHK